MARKRNDFDKTLPGRFLRWFNSDESGIDREMVEVLDRKTPLDRHSEDIYEAREMVEEELNRRELARTEQLMEKYHSWGETRGHKLVRGTYIVLALAIGLCIILSLLTTVENLPAFGDPTAPAHNEVSERYLEKGLEEGGSTNLVANMILDYRAFDTLGESNVLFIAVCSVILLLQVGGEHIGNRPDNRYPGSSDAQDGMGDDLILRRTARLLVPVIMLVAIYILLNGHLSPGGGFSGGAILGSALILYLNAFGWEKTERFFTFKTFRVVSLCALSFYALSKAYSFFTGANGLESGITPGTPGSFFSGGLILPLNVAVGFVVACTMYAFYVLFRRGDM